MAPNNQVPLELNLDEVIDLASFEHGHGVRIVRNDAEWTIKRNLNSNAISVLRGKTWTAGYNPETGTFRGPSVVREWLFTITLGDVVRYGQFTGRCGICNRLLSDPVSVQLGIGPICERRRRARNTNQPVQLPLDAA